MNTERIDLHIATSGDRASLDRLAQLDSAELPLGALLVGAVDGRAVAALSLGDGTVIANPFLATQDVVELLRLRARQLGTVPARTERRRRTLAAAIVPRIRAA